MSQAPLRSASLAGCAFALAALGMPCVARAETPAAAPSGPTQALSVDPLWFIYSTLSLKYERLISPSASLAVKARVGRTTVKPLDADPYDRTVIGFGVGYHIFPQPGAPMGFYGAPGIDILKRYKTTKDNTASVFIAVPFVELGYNWAHSTGLYAGGSIGIQYIIGNVPDDVGGLDALKGVVPRLSAHVGFAW